MVKAGSRPAGSGEAHGAAVAHNTAGVGYDDLAIHLGTRTLEEHRRLPVNGALPAAHPPATRAMLNDRGAGPPYRLGRRAAEPRSRLGLSVVRFVGRTPVD